MCTSEKTKTAGIKSLANTMIAGVSETTTSEFGHLVVEIHVAS